MAEASSNKRKIFDNRYEVLSRVGRGSASVVYRAKQLKNPDIEVALKVLTGHSKVKPSAELLRKEALAMVSSRHPHVIRLNDFHSLDDICYLSMEYAREGDLRQYLKKKGGKLSYKKAELFLLQAASALNFIHNKARITHRDIKPENILVFDDENIRIGDFGVALLAGEEFSLEQLQRGVGTMDYMAPEVLKGEACDMRSDIYSLGVTFYELISGTHPFEGASLAEAIDIRKDKATKSLKALHKKIPAYLSDIIEKCMRFDPEERYPTAGQLVSAFNAQNIFLPVQGKEAPPKETQPTPAAKPVQKDRQPAKLKKPSEGLSLGGTPAEKHKTPPKEERKENTEKAVEQNFKKRQQESNAKPQKPERSGENTARTQDKATKVTETPKPDSTKVVPFNQPATKSPTTPQKTADSQLEQQKPKEGGAALADRMRKMVEEHEKTKSEAPAQPIPPKPAPITEKPAPSEQEITPTPATENKEKQNTRTTPTEDQIKPHPTAQFHPEQMQKKQPAPHPQPSAVTGPSKAAPIAPVTQNNRSQPSLSASQQRSSTQRSQSSRNTTDSRTKFNIAIGAIIALLLLFLAPKLFTGSSSEEEQIANNQVETQDTTTSQTTQSDATNKQDTDNTNQIGTSQQNTQPEQAPVFRLPAVKATTLAFPLLPGGLYIGSLNSNFTGTEIPLTILSLESRRELLVTLGVPGARPSRIVLPADGSQKSFQIAANGFMYELTAKVSEDTIEGIYQNIITGEQGTWQLHPVRS